MVWGTEGSEVLPGSTWVRKGSQDCDGAYLCPPNLVVLSVYLQLLQQGSNGLPTGLDILGQQHLELLREVLARGREGQCKHLGSRSHSMSRANQVPSLVCSAKKPYEVGTAGVEPRSQVCSAPPLHAYECSAHGGWGRVSDLELMLQAVMNHHMQECGSQLSSPASPNCAHHCRASPQLSFSVAVILLFSGSLHK